MSGDTPTHGNDAQALKGWDTGAFWYPTLDRRGGLLALFLLFFVLHFNELFGLQDSPAMLFGWVPVNYGYYVLLTIGHVVFMYLIYLHWPYPSDPDIEVGGSSGQEPDVEPSAEPEGD